MEAVIDATLREYQSSRSVFNFGFSAWRAGVQRELHLAMTTVFDLKDRFQS
jgi:hypothetical protein